MNRRDALKKSGLLMGLSVTSAGLGVMLHSCQETPRVEWEPQFFTPEQAANVSAITDVLLPTTETPGALDLKVDLFVDLMCAKTLSAADQAHVAKGYDQFVETTQKMFGRDFIKLSIEEKTKVLERVGADTNTFNMAVWGSPIGEQAPIDFYRRVRQFALIGFYTSEEIGKNVLVYDPVPGEYRPCIPVEEVGNAWTL